MYRWIFLIITVCVLSNTCLNLARSPFRTPDPLTPMIKVKWAHQNKEYTLRHSHLEEYPFFKLYDPEFLKKHAIPLKEKISYRHDPDRSVSGKKLVSLIKKVIQEIKQQKKEFTHFTVLQDKDFNSRESHGLIVLKFKQHPFVVKLFLETPKSFVQPFDKGFDPIFFFFMAGGVTRHLSGFTRIKNLQLVKQKIESDPYWSSKITLPRKWFWAPPRNNTMEIVGTNLGEQGTQHINIPGVYCVIADEIKSERTFSLSNSEERTTALTLCNYLGQLIDAHISNFMLEKDTGKIAIVDTEHFPTIVGLKGPINFTSYFHWYTTLMQQCVEQMYCRTKKDRRDAQFGKKPRLKLTA